MDADAALARLRDPDDPALAALVDGLADHLAQQPVDALVDRDAVVQQVVAALREVAEDDRTRDRWIGWLDAARAEGGTHGRPLRELVPVEVLDGVRSLAEVPWTPSEDLTYDLLHHEAVRVLLEEVLAATLSRFVTGLRSLDQGALGGLGSRVANKGRGLFGAAASGLADAVRDEVTKAFEGRIGGYVEQAADEAIRGIARWIADPQHAPRMAALRRSGVDVIAGQSVADLLGEADEVASAQLVDAVLEALKTAAARDDLADDLRGRLDAALDPVADQVLATWLDDLGLQARWTEAVRVAVLGPARGYVASEAFAAWWSDLFS